MLVHSKPVEIARGGLLLLDLDAFLVDFLEDGFLVSWHGGRLRGIRELRAAGLGGGSKARLHRYGRSRVGGRGGRHLLLSQLLDLLLQRGDLLVEVGGALGERIVLFLEQPHVNSVTAATGRGISPVPPARWAT